MDKDFLIDALVKSDFDYIMDCANGPELLDSYLKYGFTGYSNMSYDVLLAEYNQRLEIGSISVEFR